MKFQEQFLCNPPPISSFLWDLAREYYKRTEAFDRTVCTGPIGRDGIMPIDHQQAAIIGRNAYLVFRDLCRAAESDGFSSKELKEAMRSYVQSHQFQQDMDLNFPRQA